MQMRITAAMLFAAILVTACAGVRQQDLDAWVGMPVEALDMHSFFITLPMIRTVTESGIEIRNYPDKRNIRICTGQEYLGSGYYSYANFSAFRNCASQLVGCDNIFYIKNGKVLEYAPTGSCYTAEFLQPEARYWRLKESP